MLGRRMNPKFFVGTLIYSECVTLLSKVTPSNCTPSHFSNKRPPFGDLLSSFNGFNVVLKGLNN